MSLTSAIEEYSRFQDVFCKDCKVAHAQCGSGHFFTWILALKRSSVILLCCSAGRVFLKINQYGKTSMIFHPSAFLFEFFLSVYFLISEMTLLFQTLHQLQHQGHSNVR